MANYCNYEVKVIGSEKACLMVFESMPYMDYKQIETKNQKNELTELMFAGNCKWSVNFEVTDVLPKVDVDSFDKKSIQEKASDYYQYSLGAKSEAFECEILVHYWSEESGFDQFDHYKNGEIIKKRKIKAPIILTSEIKRFSGPWCANSEMSNRSLTSLLII